LPQLASEEKIPSTLPFPDQRAGASDIRFGELQILGPKNFRQILHLEG